MSNFLNKYVAIKKYNSYSCETKESVSLILTVPILVNLYGENF